MNNATVGIVKLKTSDFIIQTCSCYYSTWKKIRDKGDETWNFDDIESGKTSFRKLFHQKMTIFHCCHSCFEKVVMMNSLLIKSDAAVGHCLLFKSHNAAKCSEICNACIWLYIELFKNELFAL